MTDPQQHGLATVREQLQGQAIAAKALTKGKTGATLMGGDHAMPEPLPAGHHLTGYRIQQQHPVQAPMAMDIRQAAGHPATAGTSGQTDQSSAALMPGQQPVLPAALNCHYAIRQLNTPVPSTAISTDISPIRRQRPPSGNNQGSRPITSNATTQGWG